MSQNSWKRVSTTKKEHTATPHRAVHPVYAIIGAAQGCKAGHRNCASVGSMYVVTSVAKCFLVWKLPIHLARRSCLGMQCCAILMLLTTPYSALSNHCCLQVVPSKSLNPVLCCCYGLSYWPSNCYWRCLVLPHPLVKHESSYTLSRLLRTEAPKESPNEPGLVHLPQRLPSQLGTPTV